MITLGWNNVASTLYQRCPTLFRYCVTLFLRCFNVRHWRCVNFVKIRRRILFHFQRRISVISTLIHNVETTVIRRWNVAWVTKEVMQWRRGVVIITKVQLHSTKPEIRFCAGSNPARRVSETRHGEDLWQWSRLEARLNAFCRSTISQQQYIIIIIIIIIMKQRYNKWCYNRNPNTRQFLFRFSCWNIINRI